MTQEIIYRIRQDITLVILLLLILIIIVVVIGVFTNINPHIIIGASIVLLILVLISPVFSIVLTEEYLVLENRRLLPFLTSREVIKLTDIESFEFQAGDYSLSWIFVLLTHDIIYTQEQYFVILSDSTEFSLKNVGSKKQYQTLLKEINKLKINSKDFKFIDR